MHKKEKGVLGEISVAKDILSLGIPVFTELGDNSKVDLIALVDNRPLKIQVKAYTIKKGTITISKIKSGPNYKFTYQNIHLDLFAIYVLEKDFIFYVPYSMFGDKKHLIFRINPTKNNQTKNVRFAEDFRYFNKVIEENFGFKHQVYKPPELTFKEAQKDIPKKPKQKKEFVTLNCSFCKKPFDKEKRILNYTKTQSQENFYCCRSHQVSDQQIKRWDKIS